MKHLTACKIKTWKFNDKLIELFKMPEDKFFAKVTTAEGHQVIPHAELFGLPRVSHLENAVLEAFFKETYVVLSKTDCGLKLSIRQRGLGGGNGHSSGGGGGSDGGGHDHDRSSSHIGGHSSSRDTSRATISAEAFFKPEKEFIAELASSACSGGHSGGHNSGGSADRSFSSPDWGPSHSHHRSVDRDVSAALEKNSFSSYLRESTSRSAIPAEAFFKPDGVASTLAGVACSRNDSGSQSEGSTSRLDFSTSHSSVTGVTQRDLYREIFGSSILTAEKTSAGTQVSSGGIGGLLLRAGAAWDNAETGMSSAQQVQHLNSTPVDINRVLTDTGRAWVEAESGKSRQREHFELSGREAVSAQEKVWAKEKDQAFERVKDAVFGAVSGGVERGLVAGPAGVVPGALMGAAVGFATTTTRQMIGADDDSPAVPVIESTAKHALETSLTQPTLSAVCKSASKGAAEGLGEMGYRMIRGDESQRSHSHPSTEHPSNLVVAVTKGAARGILEPLAHLPMSLPGKIGVNLVTGALVAASEDLVSKANTVDMGTTLMKAGAAYDVADAGMSSAEQYRYYSSDNQASKICVEAESNKSTTRERLGSSERASATAPEITPKTVNTQTVSIDKSTVGSVKESTAEPVLKEPARVCTAAIDQFKSALPLECSLESAEITTATHLQPCYQHSKPEIGEATSAVNLKQRTPIMIEPTCKTFRLDTRQIFFLKNYIAIIIESKPACKVRFWSKTGKLAFEISESNWQIKTIQSLSSGCFITFTYALNAKLYDQDGTFIRVLPTFREFEITEVENDCLLIGCHRERQLVLETLKGNRILTIKEERGSIGGDFQLLADGSVIANVSMGWGIYQIKRWDSHGKNMTALPRFTPRDIRCGRADPSLKHIGILSDGSVLIKAYKVKYEDGNYEESSLSVRYGIWNWRDNTVKEVGAELVKTVKVPQIKEDYLKNYSNQRVQISGDLYATFAKKELHICSQEGLLYHVYYTDSDIHAIIQMSEGRIATLCDNGVLKTWDFTSTLQASREAEMAVTSPHRAHQVCESLFDYTSATKVTQIPKTAIQLSDGCFFGLKEGRVIPRIEARGTICLWDSNGNEIKTLLKEQKYGGTSRKRLKIPAALLELSNQYLVAIYQDEMGHLAGKIWHKSGVLVAEIPRFQVKGGVKPSGDTTNVLKVSETCFAIALKFNEPHPETEIQFWDVNGKMVTKIYLPYSLTLLGKLPDNTIGIISSSDFKRLDIYGRCLQTITGGSTCHTVSRFTVLSDGSVANHKTIVKGTGQPSINCIEIWDRTNVKRHEIADAYFVSEFFDSLLVMKRKEVADKVEICSRDGRVHHTFSGSNVLVLDYPYFVVDQGATATIFNFRTNEKILTLTKKVGESLKKLSNGCLATGVNTWVFPRKREPQMSPRSGTTLTLASSLSEGTATEGGQLQKPKSIAEGLSKMGCLSVETEAHRLIKNAQKLGFVCEDTLPDGNCFFEAVSRQLANLPDLHRAALLDRQGFQRYSSLTHRELRELSVQYVCNHPEEFTGFFTEDDSFERFTQRMRQTGVHAEFQIVVALARVLNVTLVIIRSDQSPPTIIRQPSPMATLYLGYEIERGRPHSLDYQSGHYQSLRPLESTPPIVYDITQTEVDGASMQSTVARNP